MKTVVIDWKDHVGNESKRAIEMSLWCRQSGLQHNEDYTWRLDNARRQTLFSFNDDKESMSSMFILRWS
jgi:hypothetical protein